MVHTLCCMHVPPFSAQGILIVQPFLSLENGYTGTVVSGIKLHCLSFIFSHDL